MPIVVPGVASVVVFGVFHLRADRFLGRFWRDRIDDRLAEDGINVGDTKFGHDEKWEKVRGLRGRG